MKIGVIVDSFRKDFKSAIAEAKAIGADGVQIGDLAAYADLCPVSHILIPSSPKNRRAADRF